jgi:hypothetical protein
LIRIKEGSMTRSKNELARVLALAAEFRAFSGSRGDFAKKKRLHPSALSRILRVSELEEDLLAELALFKVLSRTHLEVIAATPEERRALVLAAVRAGRSTYAIRARKESSRVALEAPPAPVAAPLATPPSVDASRLAEVSRALGASKDETLAFALELLMVLWRSGPDRVSGSFAAWRPRARAAS